MKGKMNEKNEWKRKSMKKWMKKKIEWKRKTNEKEKFLKER